MRTKYERVAWLLDDGVLLKGVVCKKVFYPNFFGCGFSSQKIKVKDIGKTIFFIESDAKNLGLEIV